MGKRLVICEKASVAGDVVAALPGSFKKTGDLYESDAWVVGAASGHLVEQLEPDEYDERYRRWRFEDLPIIPEKAIYEARDERSAKQLKTLHKAMKRKDVDAIVNACDAGREGELIFKLIYETAGVDKPIERAWFSSMTRDAIREAFEHLRDDHQMKPLEDAARARDQADWLVGMNATRAATVKVGSPRNPIPLGRVKTPTLALIARRDEEIAAFVPVPYWEVHAVFESAAGSPYPGTWRRGTESRLASAEEAEQVAEAARTAGAGAVVEVTKRPKVEQPKPLFDLTSLQREANSKLGFTARRTLSAAQSLYDTHKLLTYPRTNSKFLTSDMAGSLKGIAAHVGRGDRAFADAADFVTSLPSLPLERVIADDKVGDHHAIIPTDAPQSLTGLSSDERRVYDLVAKRFLAVFHPPARSEVTSVVTEAGGERFRSSGTVVIEAGWKAVYGVEATPPEDAEPEEREEGDADDERRILPPLAEGEDVGVREVEVLAKETQPPAHYSENKLLQAMETAGKFVDDEEAAEAMRESGLGTPATRAETIERLIKDGYIERVGRQLRATPKGLGVIRMLGDHDLTSPALTGEWEQRLQRIQEGQESGEAFMSDIRDYTARIVDWFSGKDRDAMKLVRREIGPCPWCDGTIVEMPLSYSCTSYRSKKEPGCGYTIWRTTGGKEITPEEAERLVAEKTDPATLAAAGVRELGPHSETGLMVSARIGRYGPYVTEDLPEDAPAKAKGRTASLLASMTFETVTLEDAERLLTIPRTLAVADGEDIVVANGRYGPYIKQGKETRSLPDEAALFTITLEEAQELLAQPKERRGRGGAAQTLRELGPDPTTGGMISLKAGRYGPYVTDGETNASVPKGDDPDAVTLERAAELLVERRAKGPAKRKRPKAS
jgi:DNA topoisomerase-3